MILWDISTLTLFVKTVVKIADFMDVDAIDIGKEAYEQIGYQITKIQLTAYGICPKMSRKN